MNASRLSGVRRPTFKIGRFWPYEGTCLPTRRKLFCRNHDVAFGGASMLALAPHFLRLSARHLLAAALLWPVTLFAKPPAAPHLERFEVGLARSCFPNVNVNDAVAAYRVLLKNIGRDQGYEIAPIVTVYEDTPRFAAAIQQRTLHLLVMDAWQFLELEQLPQIRPVFVPAVDGRLGRRFVVLVRRDSGIRTMADLHDQSVLILESINNNVCHHWLDALLAADHFPQPAKFFDRLEIAGKPTAAVLPVFFGQKTACIVDEAGFNLMKELNPQVGRVLEAFAISEPFVDIVLCLGENGWPWPEARADAIRILAHLDADPAGRQVLALFKISGQVAYQESQLQTVRALRQRCAPPPPPSLAGVDHP